MLIPISTLTVLHVMTILLGVSGVALNVSAMIVMAKRRKVTDEIIPDQMESAPEAVVPISRYANPILDFELCVGLEKLKETVRRINQSQYFFAGVAQDGETYTVFFRRYV